MQSVLSSFEYIATVLIFNSVAALKILIAISPRLATNNFYIFQKGTPFKV